jgi:hypothetical protein
VENKKTKNVLEPIQDKRKQEEKTKSMSIRTQVIAVQS